MPPPQSPLLAPLQSPCPPEGGGLRPVGEVWKEPRVSRIPLCEPSLGPLDVRQRGGRLSASVPLLAQRGGWAQGWGKPDPHSAHFPGGGTSTHRVFPFKLCLVVGLSVQLSQARDKGLLH